MDFVGVFLDKAAGKPLYQQLYGHLAEQVTSGTLAAGEKLPGKRSAAAQLGVSVHTVEEAYSMLAAEGYVTAKPRSGFVVNRVEQQLPAIHFGASATAPAPSPAAAGEGGRQNTWRYNLSSSGLDTSLFPRKMWNRLQREVLADVPGLFDRGEAAGDEVLRGAIAAYLQGYRGVRCTTRQVVVGAGLELLCSMLVRLFPDKAVAVESPGYPKTAHILHNEGLAIRPVPVDAEGMVPALLEKSGAGIAYLTPSHQFPTGGVMPVGRRTALLGWAGGGRLVIEDDYDSEFRFDGRPLPSLQGLDEGGNVVYAGTFSRSLAPGLRVAYLVLPPALLAAWQAAYGDYACTVSRPEQHTLARLMEGGHFSRSVNRARGVYKARRDALAAELGPLLPSTAYLDALHTGLYFLLRLEQGDAMEIARQARQEGLRIRAAGEYLLNGTPGSAALEAGPSKNDTPRWNALVVGYGGLHEQDIPSAATALAALLR